MRNCLIVGLTVVLLSSSLHAADARYDTAWISDLSFTTSSFHPVTNSLGMEFLPAGTPNVLVSRWETRVEDFAAFVQATGYDALSESTDGKRPFTLESDAANPSGYDWKQAGGSWQDPHFPQTPRHPATCISYHDAIRFCAWLTRHEADQGKLPKGWRYRLPTDEEWSRAAGAVEYPWGGHWPPTARDGNYCGTESRIGFTNTAKWKCLEIFRDLHPRTAPVGSYPSNAFGLFDMGGNVWEWCSTWYQTNLNKADLNDPAIVQGFPALLEDGGGRQNRVVRGGSWHAQRQVDLRTRFRGIGDPRIRFDDFGFRCILSREERTASDMYDKPAPKQAARRGHIRYSPPLTWPFTPPPDCPFEPLGQIVADALAFMKLTLSNHPKRMDHDHAHLQKKTTELLNIHIWHSRSFACRHRPWIAVSRPTGHV